MSEMWYALESKVVQSATEEDDTELRDMTRRFWVAVALGVPVLLLAMLPMIGVPLDQWHLSLGPGLPSGRNLRFAHPW